jgi:predicted dithiol-disulfide oxidoreductase (DUF899 family)
MTPVDSGIRFPGESEEYRSERNRLLEAETELRRKIEQVAAQRRALPLGGVVPDDYVFEEAADGGEVRFSELFEPGQDTLVIYSFMFPWATELMYAPRDEGEEPRHVDSIWPIWNVLDLTPEGRGSGSNFPSLRYD